MRIICYSCERKVTCEYGHDHYIEGVVYDFDKLMKSKKYTYEDLERAFVMCYCPECHSQRVEMD